MGPSPTPSSNGYHSYIHLLMIALSLLNYIFFRISLMPLPPSATSRLKLSSKLNIKSKAFSLIGEWSTDHSLTTSNPIVFITESFVLALTSRMVVLKGNISTLLKWDSPYYSKLPCHYVIRMRPSEPPYT